LKVVKVFTYPFLFSAFILKSNYYWGYIFLPFGRAHQDL